MCTEVGFYNHMLIVSFNTLKRERERERERQRQRERQTDRQLNQIDRDR